jgi:hypothetical protein
VYDDVTAGGPAVLDTYIDVCGIDVIIFEIIVVAYELVVADDDAPADDADVADVAV